MLIFILSACPAPNTTNTTTTKNQQIDSTAFFVNWGSSGISVRVESSLAGSWWFGMAETSNEEADFWTGEDCYKGDLLYDAIPISWCHPIQASDTMLRYGGDPASLHPGKETAMSPQSIERLPMYYFFEVWSNQCFIAGSGAGQYDRLCQNPANITITTNDMPTETDTGSD